MERWRQVLKCVGMTQNGFSRELGINRGAMSRIVNEGMFPPGREGELKKRIETILTERGANVKGLFEEKEKTEVTVMLSQKAKKAYGLTRNPFVDDVNGQDDIFWTKNSLFVAQYMHSTARRGGMLCVIGESGSGKTSLRRQVLDRLRQEKAAVKVIFPRTVDKGRLTASAICDAVIEDVSSERPKRTLEAKARQVERLLTASASSGWRHCVMLEEAHDLTIQTLKYLKRFWEMEDGFKKLLSFVLIAQPEMKVKLDEGRNFEAREITRRIEVAELEPLSCTEDLQNYVSLKFERVGANAAGVFCEGSFGALSERLERRTRGGERYSMAYPLVVNNMVKRALNLAADLGASKVDAEIIKEC